MTSIIEQIFRFGAENPEKNSTCRREKLYNIWGNA